MKSETLYSTPAFRRQTICHHPRIMRLVHRLASWAFRCRGWRFDTHMPAAPKYVMVVAPHTSNWDFFLLVAMGTALGRQVRFMCKHSIFIGPLGSLLRWLGGIPVERGNRHNFVAQMVEQFDSCDDMVLIITPEGTRSRVSEWKGGFYHIAAGAGVPVVALALDYGRREVRVVAEVTPGGAYANDVASLTEAYRGVTACHPDKDGIAR